MKKVFHTLLASSVALAVGISAICADFTPAAKLSSTARIIEQFYVADIDTTRMVDDAIRAMLETLDPHSSYSTPEETRELTEPLQGNFSGIGITFNMLNDTLYVVSTVAGGPCEQVGIIAGDRILAAGDSVISGVKRSTSSVRNILRGPKGSVVNLSVSRGGAAPMTFRVTRDEIPIYSVDAALMATPTIGYIRLMRFAETSGQEVLDAIKRLQRQGMKDLILDLQDNGGGYLGSSTEIAEMFLQPNDLIVYTEGDRIRPSYHRSNTLPYFPVDGRVVILLNQNSASASEILAGAIQDNDRGVVIGRRSFGKGLVQRPFPFPDGSMIRLTVSRYHTPSGRCIQKPYTSGDDENYSADISHRLDSGELFSADSVHLSGEVFYTLNSNRPVYGGGGIMPDRFVPLDTAMVTPYYRQLRAKALLNRLVLTYLDDHRDELKRQFPRGADFIRDFEVDSTILNTLAEMAQAEDIEGDARAMEECAPLLRTVLKAMLARDIYDNESFYTVINEIDPIYLEALRMLQTPGEYDTILAPRPPVQVVK